MVRSRQVFRCLLPALLVLLPGLAAAATPVVAPHRAVYTLKLASAADGGAVTQANGKLEFEWADACTGWTISQRTHVRLIASEGQVLEFGWSLSALELKDGSLYRFFIRRFNPGEPPEEVKGVARIPAPGGAGSARFEGPEPRSLDLPAGTLFPGAHSLLLLEAAQRGEVTLGRVVFDGSGDEGIFFVNAAVLEPLPAGETVPLESPLLRGQSSWRVNLAYFGMDETVSEPEHEQALHLYANGVVDDLILDYGDFALRASLESLEPLPGAGC